MQINKRGGKGQITLWAIIAILIIVSGILVYFFVIRPSPKYPSEIMEIEKSYISCLESLTNIGKNLLMQKGGRIYDIPDEREGLYIGNNLKFMGEKIAYWSYFDSSGIYKENMPSIDEMEKEIEKFISENIDYCDDILKEKAEFEKKFKYVKVKIREKEIEIDASIDLKIRKNNKEYFIQKHSFSIDSNLKSLYENAKNIFEYEKSKKFLENYTYDVIFLYAKTNGIEIQCTPLVFDKKSLKNEIINGLNVNIERIKFKGNYFKPGRDTQYYLNELNIDEGIFVNLIYLPTFPTKIEIYGGEDYGDKIKFDPIGTQQGLNLIGFCYVPYHLVYDVKYPVLVILTKENEIFKFPVVVVIERNAAKEILEENQTLAVSPICETKNTNAYFYIYDKNDKPIDANVYFKCLDKICYLGKAENGYIETKVPECVNGFIIFDADGYAEKKFQVDSLDDFGMAIVLDKIFEKNLELELRSDEHALVFFEGENNYVVNYPEQKTINISEGYYNVTVYVFKEKNIEFNQTTEVCWDVPVLFGITRKQCSEISGGSFDNVIVGGGKSKFYLDEYDLKESRKIVIEFERFETPESIEDVEKNFELIELNEINIKLE